MDREEGGLDIQEGADPQLDRLVTADHVLKRGAQLPKLQLLANKTQEVIPSAARLECEDYLPSQSNSYSLQRYFCRMVKYLGN